MSPDCQNFSDRTPKSSVTESQLQRCQLQLARNLDNGSHIREQYQRNSRPSLCCVEMPQQFAETFQVPAVQAGDSAAALSLLQRRTHRTGCFDAYSTLHGLQRGTGGKLLRRWRAWL
ncbi:hypothetical protein RvY_16658-4 [Ramazzottius varieornatus]|uniref:Uncharacterized protein n=1 Tax=Ramazzottius varieornatus TaxID=947166 RepID=A0A1D1VZA0_RAMVA|nr:hypothetical protein RvY_16658-4 [Ramazzottius varieornatus]